MSVRAAWLLPTSQTREDTRLSPVGTFTPAAELRTRPGIVPGGNPFAATGAGAMTLQIGTGRAIVQGTTAQGAYPVTVDVPETVTFADGHAQFGRYDAVIIHVYDQLFDTSGQNIARVEIVQGEPLATPVAPTLPAASLLLWLVTVPAGTSAGAGGISWSSALADRRQFTTAAGGITPAGGGTSYTGAYDGQYRDTGSGLERWNATAAAWQAYPPTPARPLMTRQVTQAPIGTTTGAFVDFTAAQWPRIVFTVPPSGAVWISVNGQVSNRNTTSATAWMTWRATGGYTEAAGSLTGLSAQGGRVIGTRRAYRSGLTPGASVTIIPGWNVSSIGTDTFITDGQLTVEFVQ
ncbi:hypothetical protein ABZZ74_49165 [Streptomyces sp. NPDC006476]|uniref:hypothetical protein n=1 Tax=Streptomyces sp. NPDC006476 TaxID=3157175 RepID=UPI0033A52ADC